MTAEEFLISMWNKCIWMFHEDYPENIVMIYDKQYERRLKLNSLNNSNDDIKFKKSDDTKILFYQDYKNGYLDINYNEIWSILDEKYGLNYDEIKELIHNSLLEDNKLKNLTTEIIIGINQTLLLEDNKLKNLTPSIGDYVLTGVLLEDNKLKQLTPRTALLIDSSDLLEDNKLKNI